MGWAPEMETGLERVEPEEMETRRGLGMAELEALGMIELEALGMVELEALGMAEREEQVMGWLQRHW